jgi:hypothetical protein
VAIGDLDSGARFGLPPIGLSQATLETGASDTQRRQMPGLATKNSVFDWLGPASGLLISNTGVTGTINDTINIRQNTALNGSSFDVPTWAAGAVVSLNYKAATMGTSTYHLWTVQPTIVSSSIPQLAIVLERVNAYPGNESRQVVVPFFDEPIILVGYNTNGSGTGTYSMYLVGFVRNV